MRAWMDLFMDYMTAKRYLADALRAVLASNGTLYAESRTRVTAASPPCSTLVPPQALSARMSKPNDALIALSGVSLATGEPAQRQQAGRLLDLLTEGLRQHGSV